MEDRFLIKRLESQIGNQDDSVSGAECTKLLGSFLMSVSIHHSTFQYTVNDDFLTIGFAQSVAESDEMGCALLRYSPAAAC
jgi:hypothetical protein